MKISAVLVLASLLVTPVMAHNVTPLATLKPIFETCNQMDKWASFEETVLPLWNKAYTYYVNTEAVIGTQEEHEQNWAEGIDELIKVSILSGMAEMNSDRPLLCKDFGRFDEWNVGIDFLNEFTQYP